MAAALTTTGISTRRAARLATGQTKGEVLINFLSADVTIKVTESNASNCADPPQQQVVIVKRRPVLANLDVSLCGEDREVGITLNTDASSPVPAVQYNVTAPPPDFGIVSLVGPTTGTVSPNGIINDKFENPTSSPARAVYHRAGKCRWLPRPWQGVTVNDGRACAECKPLGARM